MPVRTPRELSILRDLTPHTRGHVLQLLAGRPLLTITSGRRSVAHNKRVGGVPNSWHLQGRAVDLVGPIHDLHLGADEAWRLRLGPNCTGPEEVLLEHLGEPGAHLHVAW